MYLKVTTFFSCGVTGKHLAHKQLLVLEHTNTYSERSKLLPSSWAISSVGDSLADQSMDIALLNPIKANAAHSKSVGHI